MPFNHVKTIHIKEPLIAILPGMLGMTPTKILLHLPSMLSTPSLNTEMPAEFIRDGDDYFQVKGVTKSVNSGHTHYLIGGSSAYQYDGTLKKVLTVEGNVQIQDITGKYALLSTKGYRIDGSEHVENHLATLSNLNQTYTSVKLTTPHHLKHMKIWDDDRLLLASATSFFIYSLKMAAFEPLLQANPADT